MSINHEAAAEKRLALKSIAASARQTTPSLDDSALESLIDVFARVTPPEEPEEPEEPPITIRYITITSLQTPTAKSQKPGNILLNWRKLIDIVPDVTFAGIGATTLPISPAWALPLAGLYVWNKLLRGATEEFTPAEATTILALWKHRNTENRIPEDDGFARTNELRMAAELAPLSKTEFANVINRLIKINCLQIDSGVIWLREWIRVKYSS